MKRALLTLALFSLVAGAVATPVAAQNTATPTPTPTQTPPGYYDGEPGTVDNSGWLGGLTDASLDDILTMLTRVGPWAIGSAPAQGGVGSAGVLLTGGLVGSIVLGTGVRGRVGPVGGAVFAVASSFAFLSVGVGPGWLYAVVLFVVGLVVSVALIRAFR